ncbi:hypothetical protein CEXT_94131 [Caerostris extrusa]|uniref:Ribosomal protein S18 n=1 Tax=Caerostris extrusa TaxID=172846 RepID=A0AAV4WXX1_CAEEX|nr:hypothetical protein CEXT_94131 [Caerostris extrusa]
MPLYTPKREKKKRKKQASLKCCLRVFVPPKEFPFVTLNHNTTQKAKRRFAAACPFRQPLISKKDHKTGVPRT